jgi:hypothetical protein
MAATAIKQPTVTFCVGLLSNTPSRPRNGGNPRSVAGRNIAPMNRPESLPRPHDHGRRDQDVIENNFENQTNVLYPRAGILE